MPTPANPEPGGAPAPRPARASAGGLMRSAARTSRAIRRPLELARGASEARAAIAALRNAAPSPIDSAPRVVVDGCAFQEPQTGIARLWAELLAAWSESGFARHVVVLDRGHTAPRLPGFSYRDLPAVRAKESASQRQLLDAACRAEQADVFVSTLYTRPETHRTLLFVHDFAPEMMGFDLRLPIWREKAEAITHASAYVCNSKHTAADLLRLYPSSASKPCAIALPGVGSEFSPAPPEQITALEQELELPDHYFLFVGFRDSYKNAELLFAAVAEMQTDPDIGLVMVGGGPSLEPQFAAQAGRVPVTVSRLSDEQLRAAYSGAAALVFVSHYEGFGLVVLEAMACGCPVIASRSTAIPEAAGDAALYVDEHDATELRDAMRRVLDPEVRSDLIARGLARAATFSWAETGRRVQAAIEEAAR